MIQFKTRLLIAFFLMFSNLSNANIKLPALVGDNMVLQRDTKITLWGWATPGEKVNIQFQNQNLKTIATKLGKWSVVLLPVSAGGPYEMRLKGNNEIVVRNILVGDVWLASGQSNMEMALTQINNSKKEIDSANYPKIRLFQLLREGALNPKDDVLSDGGWNKCSSQTVEKFSAVAYLFGCQLYNEYKVPIGLINSTCGGTPAEVWVSQEALKTLPFMKEQITAFKNISEKDALEYENYATRRRFWKKKFGNIDRGNAAGSTSWADIDLNTNDWQIMQQPLMWKEFPSMKQNVLALKGYNGTIWFRKEIDIPQELAGKPIDLNLGGIIMSDTTFFNGQVVGETVSLTLPPPLRVYTIPGCLVHAGRNVIAMKITGINEFFGGTKGPDMFIKIGNRKMSLVGEWLYKPAPDLTSYPEPVALTNSFIGMPSSPSILYNSMIAPLVPYAIKGVIWYQGESNANTQERAEQYSLLFPTLIKDWRSRWGYDFPFLFVQLAGFQPNKTEPADYVWSTLRESQAKTLNLPNTGMATAIDIGEENDIHPKNKQDVAHRLFLAAQKVAYQEDIVYSGPSFKSAKIEGNKIRISFGNIGSGLMIKDKYRNVGGFAIAGVDKKFAWARAWQEGNEIVLMSDEIKSPIYVRYNWENTPDGNLFNKEGLPATPFRTDK